MTVRLATAPLFGTAIALAIAADATASLTFQFSLTGASGEFAGESFTDREVAWYLDTNRFEVQQSGPNSFFVRPNSGMVVFDDFAGPSSMIAPGFLAESMLWATSSASQGLRIGFGAGVPFEILHEGAYAGPFGWDMRDPFSGPAVGSESILRAIAESGIATLAGPLIVTSYETAFFASFIIPAPAAPALLAIGGVALQRRRRDA